MDWGGARAGGQDLVLRAGLPKELVTALREAVCRAEYDQMLILVDQVAALDGSLGLQLRSLVQRFDYVGIQKVLAKE